MESMLKRTEKSHRRRTRGVLACLSVLVALAATVAARPAAQAHSTLVVPRDFPTIQAAVDAAASGDTVVVRAGTYTEQVVVSGKNVNLLGAGEHKTVIKAPTTLTPYGQSTTTGRQVAAIVRIAHAAHVRMSGFTVTGPIPCDLVSGGIVALQSSVLDLSDSAVNDIHPDPSCSADEATGRAVVFGLTPAIQVDGAPGGTASGRITHVKVARYLGVGISLDGPPGVPPTQVTVKDNVITGGAQIPTEQFGIALLRNAVAAVTGNKVFNAVCTFEGCGADPITEFQSGGILAAADTTGTRISRNYVTDTDIGIYQITSPNCCQISRNQLKDNRFFGIAIQDGNGETDHNKISGGQVGIGVVADAVDTTGILRGDRITGTTVARVREIQCCGFKATAVVKPD